MMMTSLKFLSSWNENEFHVHISSGNGISTFIWNPQSTWEIYNAGINLKSNSTSSVAASLRVPFSDIYWTYFCLAQTCNHPMLEPSPPQTSTMTHYLLTYLSAISWTLLLIYPAFSKKNYPNRADEKNYDHQTKKGPYNSELIMLFLRSINKPETGN